MKDVTVSSWGELQESLFEGIWNPAIRRFRSNFAYRGGSNCDYRLETTLMRMGGNYAELERHLLRNFTKYAHAAIGPQDTIWNWLAIAQHHGLPTRLLDFTYSPYVALHFATVQPNFPADGVIWCIDYVGTHRLLPARMRKIIEAEQSNAFTASMINEAAASFESLQRLSRQPFVFFFEPPSLDQRITNQAALFAMVSDPSVSLDKWLRQHEELYRRIMIPRKLKWEVRDKLDQANITERILFPGLDGLSRWLRRHYATVARGLTRPSRRR